MNNDYSDLQKKLKQESIENASLQGIDYSEPSKPPTWISYGSWGFGAICGFIFFVGILTENENLLGSLVGGIIFCLIIKAISYSILRIFFEGGKLVKKGATIVTTKIATAVEKEHQKSRLEQEKKFLKERINDLELQNLRNRVAELEKELHNKNK